MPFTIVTNDITKMEVDAVVNAANTGLQRGGGVCGAIFQLAGATQLQAACDKLAPIKTGEAVITPGFGLPAKFIIHAVGPIYCQLSKEESERLLRAAYTNSLTIAVKNKCQSIAFPLISSGIYGYPKEEALTVAMGAIEDFLKYNDIDVALVIFDKSTFSLGREWIGAVESFIDENFVGTSVVSEQHLPISEKLLLCEAPSFPAESTYLAESASLEDLVGNLDESFSDMLLKLIDAKSMTDVEVYKRANLDRKLFSKIRSNKNYMPSKRTAIALAVGLGLSPDETDDFLERAGYALSNAVIFDVIIDYFITNGKYDIFEINQVLFSYDQPLLGG